MIDYSMSEDLFRQRACEEDGCMISALGSGLARAMGSARVNVSLTEEEQIRSRQDSGRSVPVSE